jgi:hypothetical protein
MVAPLAASLSKEVAFVIEVSGWQGPAWRQDAVRVEAELRADGFPESDIHTATAFARKRMELIRGNGPFEELDQAQKAVEMFSWFPYVHRCDATRFYAARRMVSYDSGPSWEKVRCPVLVIYGDKDTSSGPPDNLVEIIRRGLTKAGNSDVTVRIFHNADHSLCKSGTGGRNEAGKRIQTRKKGSGPDLVPGYVDTMTAWLAKRFGPAGPAGRWCCCRQPPPFEKRHDRLQDDEAGVGSLQRPLEKAHVAGESQGIAGTWSVRFRMKTRSRSAPRACSRGRMVSSAPSSPLMIRHETGPEPALPSGSGRPVLRRAQSSFPSAKRPGHNYSSERASNWLTGSKQTERSRVRKVDMGESPLSPTRAFVLACSLARPYENGV